MENSDYSEQGGYDDCLEKIIIKIPHVTQKLIYLVLKDFKKSDKILELFTEQELKDHSRV